MDPFREIEKHLSWFEFWLRILKWCVVINLALGLLAMIAGH